MGRTKQRSLNPYKGERRRHRAVKVKDAVLMDSNPDEVRNAAPVSASARKMEVFGICFDDLCVKRKYIGHTDDSTDYFAFIQSSCLASLVEKLLCPCCKTAAVKISLLEKKCVACQQK